MTSNEYIYVPLQNPTDQSFEVRLLMLLPLSNGPEICVKIFKETISKSGDDKAQYDALSYTWGDVNDTKEIQVQEETETTVIAVKSISGEQQKPQAQLIKTLAVTTNLYSALQHLRYDDCPRTLWIDAICINQSPKTKEERNEKNWSVQHMQYIYMKAGRLVIWLGPESQNSSIAMNSMRGFGSLFAYDELTQQFRKVRDSDSELSPQQRANQFNPEALMAIWHLVQRQWFDRVWIRQEAYTATESSLVCCGGESISVSDFKTALQVIYIHVQLPDHFPNTFVQRLTLVLNILQKGFGSILVIMARIRPSQCFLPHDKIYGALGVMKMVTRDKFADRIEINYDKSVQEIYLDFFLQYLDEKKSLKLLGDGGLCQNSDLPISWLPDWTKTINRLDLSLEMSASQCMLTEASYQGNGMLRVHGVTANTIESIAFMKPTQSEAKVTDEEQVAELHTVMKENLPKQASEASIASFGRALGSYLLNLQVPIEELELQKYDIVRLVYQLYFNGKLDAYVDFLHPQSWDHFIAAINFFRVSKLPFIFTEDGHSGVGSAECQPGDLISVLIGVSNLVILRPAQDQRYQLVGSCFMHGYNWGEALLGPLPTNVIVFPRLVREFGLYRPYFVNTVSREETFWDPRINWDELEVTPGVRYAGIVNAPNGEPDRQTPTVQYLKSKGIDAKTYDLV